MRTDRQSDASRADAAVVFEDVCFAYEREEVLHNIDFCLCAGALVGVVGPNGGGKSTLLRLMLGLLTPSRGRVLVFGQRPREARRRMGYVPQHLQFDTAFPVCALDVVLMGRADRHVIGPYRRSDREAAHAALDQVKADALASRRFADLSGGERQRVLIAQALTCNPDLLLLDEPTANVDPRVEHEIYDLLHELNEHVTVIAVSHNVNVVTRHAGQVGGVNRAASVLPISQLTQDQLAAVGSGDMAVLQHLASCHVLDPSAALQAPHHCGCAGPADEAEEDA